MIKIDRSFLVDLPGDPQATAIVEAILALATACGCDVVCEGVETEAQLEFLRAGGCLLAQGFGLGRPQPAEAITELLIAELAASHRTASEHDFPQAASRRSAAASYQRIHLRTALSETPYLRPTALKPIRCVSSIRTS